MKLTHVGVSNFRSIGEECVTIDLTKKINVLVGANNCGKSNVLRALCAFGNKAEEELDRHYRADKIYPRWDLMGLAELGDHALLQKLQSLRFSWEHIDDGGRYVSDPFENLTLEELEPFWAKHIQNKETIA